MPVYNVSYYYTISYTVPYKLQSPVDGRNDRVEEQLNLYAVQPAFSAWL